MFQLLRTCMYKKPPLSGIVPVFIAPSGFCLGRQHYTIIQSIRWMRHQLKLDQMTTVADGAPLYNTASLRQPKPTVPKAAGSCRPHCPESRFITKEFSKSKFMSGQPLPTMRSNRWNREAIPTSKRRGRLALLQMRTPASKRPVQTRQG